MRSTIAIANLSTLRNLRVPPPEMKNNLQDMKSHSNRHCIIWLIKSRCKGKPRKLETAAQKIISRPFFRIPRTYLPEFHPTRPNIDEKIKFFRQY